LRPNIPPTPRSIESAADKPIEAPIEQPLPQDLQFLVSQGCFIVPQRAALDDFLRQYFLHVHPMLPILNEKDFWLSYNSVEGDVEYEMPMLVLQGVLFISSGVSKVL